MSVHNSFFSSGVILFPKSSQTLRLIFPEALRSMCWKASSSPCKSARKCSVGFGNCKIASRFIISVVTLDTVGKSRASRRKYRRSSLTSSIVTCGFDIIYLYLAYARQAYRIPNLMYSCKNINLFNKRQGFSRK